LQDIHVPVDQAPWRVAVVTEVNDTQATIGLQPNFKPTGGFTDERETGVIPLALMQWARSFVDGMKLGPEVKKAGQVLQPGDVVYVAPSTVKGQFHLVQIPEVEGGLVAMDPHTGRVLAMVGGFSYGNSQFNRAVQAMRQPGSSFKPIVYAAALDNGYSPASVVLDAPIEFKMKNGDVWKPKNYEKDFFGPATLRRGIEQSRNTMTVRLADALGMTKIADLAQRLGIYDHMPLQLSMALGAGETTLLKMTTAYSMIANGGKKVEPTLIDRVQDRFGRTVYKHDNRECVGCKADKYVPGMPEPDLIDNPEQVMNPFTAYQITSMMEGVVERGTGKKVQIVGKPVAGKTGTSNDEKDAWFIGFTPDLVVGTYIGFDNPKPMGKGRTGGELAAPVVADFMRLALRDKAAVPFRVPRDIELIPINVKSGKRGVYGSDGVILEAFKPGDEPPSNTLVIGNSGDPTLGVAKPGQGTVLVEPSNPDGNPDVAPIDPAAANAEQQPVQQPAQQPEATQPATQPDAGGGLTTTGKGLY
jgi:penicillin-binding protein 1A